MEMTDRRGAGSALLMKLRAFVLHCLAGSISFWAGYIPGKKNDGCSVSFPVAAFQIPCSRAEAELTPIPEQLWNLGN